MPRLPKEITPEQIRAAVMEEAQRAAHRAGLATVAEVQRLMPVKTGHGRRSITASRPSVGSNEVRVSVGSNVSYVRWLNDGTGLYGPRKEKITPKAKQALAFVASDAKGKGRPYTLAGRARRSASVKSVMEGLVVVRSVKGVEPMHFFEDGIVQSRDARLTALREAGPRIADRLGLAAA